MKDVKIKVTFIESVLGTSPSNKEIYSDYVGSKSPDANTIEQEIEALGLETVIEKGMTVFPRDDDGEPFMYDYQIKGFFKGACGFLRNVPDTLSSKVKNYKKVIDGMIFPHPRVIEFDDVVDIDILQRPLRAQTMQGERVSLASSEEINAGATLTFSVTLMRDSDYDLLKEWLDYGRFSGMGQWRNSGHGRFTWEELQ